MDYGWNSGMQNILSNQNAQGIQQQGIGYQQDGYPLRWGALPNATPVSQLGPLTAGAWPQGTQQQDALQRALLNYQPYNTLQLQGPSVSYAGNRYIVVCNGQVHELPADASLDAAQEKAEALAHQHQSEAFILKPVRKVAPKRDVVTVDL